MAWPAAVTASAPGALAGTANAASVRLAASRRCRGPSISLLRWSRWVAFGRAARVDGYTFAPNSRRSRLGERAVVQARIESHLLDHQLVARLAIGRAGFDGERQLQPLDRA